MSAQMEFQPNFLDLALNSQFDEKKFDWSRQLSTAKEDAKRDERMEHNVFLARTDLLQKFETKGHRRKYQDIYGYAKNKMGLLKENTKIWLEWARLERDAGTEDGPAMIPERFVSILEFRSLPGEEKLAVYQGAIGKFGENIKDSEFEKYLEDYIGSPLKKEKPATEPAKLKAYAEPEENRLPVEDRRRLLQEVEGLAGQIKERLTALRVPSDQIEKRLGKVVGLAAAAAELTLLK